MEDDKEECFGCGSSFVERNKHSHGLSYKKICPHCGSEKCCMCDMGDDVECGNCMPGDFDDN